MAMETDQHHETILRLTSKTDLALLPGIQKFIRSIGELENFPEKELLEIELLVEEVVLRIVNDAFEGRKDEYFDIAVERHPGQFVLAFEDKGLPISERKIKETDSKDIGMILVKGVCDEVNIFNHGKSGNRMEFIKGITRWGDRFHPAADKAHEISEIKPPEIPYAIRLMRSDEGFQLERCIYRVYGYTYSEDFYYPERIRERIESGIQVSVVAITQENEVIAHQGYVKPEKGARVADLSIGIVDPRFRAHGLFKKVKSYAAQHAKEEGLYGFYVEAVTVHPYSQKANMALGAKEMGILLGFVSENVSFKKMEEHLGSRRPVLMIYTRLNQEPERTVYPPARHQDLIQRIFENAAFHRVLGNPTRLGRNLDRTRLSINVCVDFGLAFIRILSYGDDFKETIFSNLKHLCVQKIDGIIIDLPLSQPATAANCEALEELGFFFAGIIPEFCGEDVLRMQYLNNVALNLDKVVLVTDFARELYDYCTTEYNRTQHF